MEAKDQKSMSDNDSKKFMFDLHSFDAPEEPEEDDLPPPPPTFSEEELAAAKQASFKEGHAAALEEAKNSREEYIAGQLNQVFKSYKELYEQELSRTERFEYEVITLAQTLLHQAFPTLNKHLGLDEIERVAKEAFRQYDEASEITIHINPDDKDEIEARIEVMSPKPDHLKCIADETINAGSIQMRWKDGGAIRDTAVIGKKIAEILENTLASSPQAGDNPDNKTRSEDTEIEPKQAKSSEGGEEP